MAWIQISTESQSLKMRVDFQVVLPENQKEPCTALYILHGEGQDGTSFIRHTSIERHWSSILPYLVDDIPMPLCAKAPPIVPQVRQDGICWHE